MLKDIPRTIRHLRNQIDSAKHLGSNFVYITLEEAQNCLELAEAQDVIVDILKENEELKKGK